MMGANLGPETILTDQHAYKVRQMLLEELAAMPQTPHIVEYQKRVRANKSIHDIFFEDPVEFKCLKELNICMAPNMSFYKRDEMSLWGRIMRDVYDGRKRVKKQMLAKEQELENAKNAGAPESVLTALENEIAGLDSLQHGYKIAIEYVSGLRG